MKHPRIPVEQLSEVLDDGDRGSTWGFIAKGEFDKQQFAIACNKEFELVAGEKCVSACEVMHRWQRKVPNPHGGWILHRAKPNARGAFLATVVEL